MLFGGCNCVPGSSFLSSYGSLCASGAGFVSVMIGAMVAGARTASAPKLGRERQRIIISQSQVNLLKWSCLFVQAVCALVAIAMVHSDNRLASIIAMGIFATGVAVRQCC